MGQYTTDDLARSYAYLNRLRAAAGMTPLQRNATLEHAANGHAGYLAINRAEGHMQRPGRPGFTGATPQERMRLAGYAQGRVGENAAAGNKDGIAAIDGLMAAIYHRLGFLSFNFDEVGIGVHVAEQPGESRFVYDMGDSERALAALCAALPEDALFKGQGRYYELCPQHVRIAFEAYPRLQERLENSIALSNPRIVVWPPPGAVDVPPAFFGESPDPLPDYAVSGYPVSLQFNPAFVHAVTLDALTLYRTEGEGPLERPQEARLSEVRPTRLLTWQTDPNRKLSPLEFVLFPLQRLEWRHTYALHASFMADGRREDWWQAFTTRDAGAPLYTASGDGETLPLLPGRRYAIYVPPTPHHATLGTLSYTASGAVKPQLEMLDPNTLALRVDGPVCAAAELKFDGNRMIRIRLAAADNTGQVHPPQVLYAPCGEYAADFRVAGKGEQLSVRSGQSYTVYVQPGPAGSAMGKVSWTYAAGIDARFDWQDENTLHVRTSGPVGGVVTVRLADARAFSLRIVQ